MDFIIYLFAFFKNVIYGASVFFTGELTSSVDVLDVLALRFLLSFLVLWLLKTAKLLKIRVGLKDIVHKGEHSRFIKTLLLAGLFEPVLYMFFETAGVSMTTGITAGVLLSLNPVTGCIAESLFLKEKTSLMQKIFLGIGIIGVIYIALNTNTSSGKDSIMGIIFILLAVVTGSLFLTFSRKASANFSSMEITYFSCFEGMLVFNAMNIVRHILSGSISGYFLPYFDMGNMVGFIFLGIISTIIATGMNNFAMRKMQVSTMSAFGGLSTLTTIFIGVLIGGESLHNFHIIGLILIVTRMIGVSYLAIKKDKQLN